MDFKKYKRLKKAVQTSRNAEDFLKRVASSPWWYGVPLWTKADYTWFFDKIKGGFNYVRLFNQAS